MMVSRFEWLELGETGAFLKAGFRRRFAGNGKLFSFSFHRGCVMV